MKVLLIDPKSVFHGPPNDVAFQDRSVSEQYSDTLDRAVENIIGELPDKNWNAVSTKYVSNYGLLMLGGLLKKNDIGVHYLNGDYFENISEFFCHVIAISREYNAIFMTATTPQYTEMEKLAMKVRKMGYNGYLIIGGPHCYFFKNHRQRNPFDIICIGHNIVTAVNKIMPIMRKKREHNKTIYLETMGYTNTFKDFTLIPRRFLRETLLYSYASFGCPNHCHYCSEHYFNPQMCFLDLTVFSSEINFLVNDVGVKVVHLADSDFFLFPIFAEKVLSEIISRKELTVCFTVNTSPKTICSKKTRRLIKKFYELGLVELLIGVEYFSPKVLKKMGKEYDIAEFERSLQEIRQDCPNLIISFYSLVGLPETDRSSQIENLVWFEHFFKNKLVDFSFPKFFVPYPGTDVFERPEEYNVEIIHTKWEEYHRWALPRPLVMNNISDKDLLDEVIELYNICGARVT